MLGSRGWGGWGVGGNCSYWWSLSSISATCLSSETSGLSPPGPSTALLAPRLPEVCGGGVWKFAPWRLSSMETWGSSSGASISFFSLRLRMESAMTCALLRYREGGGKGVQWNLQKGTGNSHFVRCWEVVFLKWTTAIGKGLRIVSFVGRLEQPFCSPLGGCLLKNELLL